MIIKKRLATAALVAFATMVFVIGANGTPAFAAHDSHGGNGLYRLLGAVVGGVAGSQFGKGSGKLVATGVGVLIGSLIGRGQEDSGRYRYHDGRGYYYGGNAGAEEAYRRGQARRAWELQREIERRAYECGRYGHHCY